MDCLSELKNTPAGMDAQLAKTVRFGVGFHHAGFLVENIKRSNKTRIQNL